VQLTSEREEMKKYLIDTSFAISLFNEKDSNYKNAQTKTSTLPADISIIVPVLVMIELAFNPFKENTRTTIFNNTEKLANSIININKSDINDFKLFVDKIENKIGTIDATILYLAFKHKAELLTFDKRLEKEYYNQIKLLG